MASTCTICNHDQRDKIDHALIGGATVRDTASHFDVHRSSIDRHRRQCLAPRVANALARHEELSQERLVAYAHGLLDRASLAMVMAQRNEDDHAHRAWLSEARKTIETLAKLGGIGRPDAEVHIDAREQTAIIATLSEAELRALARAAVDGERPALPAAAHVAA